MLTHFSLPYRVSLLLIVALGGCGYDVAEGTPTAGGDGDSSFPTSGPTSNDGGAVDGSSSSGDPTGGSSNSDDGSSGSDGSDPWCASSGDCADTPSTPICNLDTNQCVSCAAAAPSACADVDPNRPFCDAPSGTCGACDLTNPQSCPGEAPICDPVTLSCRGCTEIRECLPHSGSACNPSSGECLPGGNAVVHVDADAEEDDDEGVFTSIPDALDHIADEGLSEGTIILHRPSDGGDYTNPNNEIELNRAQTIAIIAADPEAPPRIVGSGNGGHGLAVESQAVVLLQGLALSASAIIGGGTRVALLVDGGQVVAQQCSFFDADDHGVVAQNNATLTLENCTIADNGDGFDDNDIGLFANDSIAHLEGCTITGNRNEGVLASNRAKVTLESCTITGNEDGGVFATNAETQVTLVNTMVAQTNNGSTAIQAQSQANVTLLYTTALGQFDSSASALSCPIDTTVTVRNSLLVTAGDADALDCASASVSHSAIEEQLDDENDDGNNVVLEDIGDSLWFISINDGDPHLNQPPPAVLTAAQWIDGDPEVDIDGHPRSITGPGVAGADVPTPQ